MSVNVAEWVLRLKYDDLPDAVRRQVRRCLLDGIGAAVAGARTRTGEVAAAFAAEMGRDGPATVLASGRRLALAPAVLANGVAANAYDIDDGYRPVKGHPGGFVIMPTISACEAYGVGGLMCAVAAGYEVAMRAGVATHRRYAHYHASGSWGALGTAACVGRVAGLDAERMGWALGLAEYHAALSPIERCLAHPAMTKDGIGWGAFAGACAAGLAEKGFTGIPCLLDEPENRGLVADLGERWRLLELYFKPYACCRWAQPAVDAALALKRRYGLAHGDVRRIVVHTFREAAELQRSPPRTPEEAQYHLSWPMAAALVYGEVGPRQVGEGALEDGAMRRVAGVVEAVAEAGIQARFPAEALAWVELETGDGRGFRSDVTPARGDAHAPLSDEEIAAKFRWLTGPAIGRDATERIVRAVAGVEEAGGQERLVEAVQASARSQA
jgi:2-methylcitrate dehydratase PrpD